MLQERIDQLTAGTGFDSSGQMHIDLTAALEKLAHGLDHSPHLLLSKLCAGLVHLEGEEIWIRNLSNGLLVAVKNPQKDCLPAALSDLALGHHGPGYKALGLALLALRSHVKKLGWVRWVQTTETAPGAPGTTRAPKNPWKNSAAVGLWLEGKLPGFCLREKLYQAVAQRLYHCPVLIRWNRYTLGMAPWESQECQAESEYVCLHPHEHGRLGVRPRASASQECWSSLSLTPFTAPGVATHQGSLRWVEAPSEPSIRQGRGYMAYPGLLLIQNYRFHLGSLQICFHSRPSGVYPVHHGEVLEMLPVDRELFPDLWQGVTVYAPADHLATDLTHSSLLEDEHCRVWMGQVMQRVREVARRISEADEELEKVTDSRSRARWFRMRGQLSRLASGQKLGEPAESAGYGLAGLFGLSAKHLAMHTREMVKGHWWLGSLEERVVTCWILPNRDLSSFWEGLEQDHPLPSALNPLHDLLVFCSKPTTAIRLAEWSQGRAVRSWVRDPLQVFRDSSPVPCKQGLVLQVYESGSFGSLWWELKCAPGVPGHGCSIRPWDGQKDPADALPEKDKALPWLLRTVVLKPLYLLLTLRDARSEHPLIQAFPSPCDRPGFPIFLPEGGRCQFQGQLHTKSIARCGMSYVAAEILTPAQLALYRFGVNVKSAPVALEWLAAEVQVDASHWDLDHSLEEQFKQDGWLEVLRKAGIVNSD